MMQKKYDTIPKGTRFGRWTVVKRVAGKTKWTVYYKCKCDCGKVKTVHKHNLLNGTSTSCNCYRNELSGQRQRTHGESHATKEYRAWKSMKRRCSNPIKRDGPNYIKYGIKVCKRWANSYSNFLKDMGRAPSPHHSLDRYPNNKGHYKPSNCRWATNLEQARNHCD